MHSPRLRSGRVFYILCEADFIDTSMSLLPAISMTSQLEVDTCKNVVLTVFCDVKQRLCFHRLCSKDYNSTKEKMVGHLKCLKNSNICIYLRLLNQFRTLCYRNEVAVLQALASTVNRVL